MALSQVQCLDDNHINLRTNESKPDFFYSEEQRLALETLIHEGRDAFEDHIKTNNIRCFLSDLELERILYNVEVYSPGSPDDNAELYGESDGEEVSLQYWPDLSDYSIPQLDIGWPNWASYRGVTRVQVYTQPPYDGQPHIKEVVRKMICQAQKVVAIVMDLFTDIDIFKDVLDASYRRKVAVYILLESTGVSHFMRMCDKAGMHTGHLKSLRVRSIRGAEFFSRSSKRVCGSQSQKFMFIDGDKAVSGSYSFTWSASRLDRNLITVLTGQAVEIFDSVFQDMYVMSNRVCLSRNNLGSEPEPEILPQAVPTLFPTANTAFKLNNPKYTLVSGCMFTTNGPDQTNANNDVTKNQKESVKHIIDAPVLPPIHPGLLNLEKANMIHYVPTWPDPEPPSDVIGFINIRDTNKPLQAHLMRSELFEVSQAIRFKDRISEPKEPVMAHPISHIQAPAQTRACTEAQSRSEATERNVEHFDQNQQEESSQSEDLIAPLQSAQPETMHVLTGNRDDKEAPDIMIKDNKNIHTDSLNSTKDVSSDAKQTLDVLQPLQCPAQTPNNPDVKSPYKPYKVIIDVDIKPVLAVDETHQNGCDTHTSNTDSSLSSLSDYYDCFSPLTDLRSKSEVLITEKPSDVQSHNQKNIHQEREFPCLNSYTAQDTTVCLDNKQTLFTPKLLKTSRSIFLNFPSFESSSISPAPFTTTPVQETLNDKSALPNKDSDPAQTREFNFSSTSEEYFECSETIGFDAVANVMESSSQLKVNDLNQNELRDTVEDSIPAVTLQIQKLTEISMQEDDESSCQNMTETGSVMTVNGHLEANNAETVSGTEQDSQNIHRHQTQAPEVTLDPEAKMLMLPERTPEMILENQPEKPETEKTPQLDLQSELSLDFMCERESVQIAEKTDKQPVLDLQLEELRTEKSPPIDLQPEVNLDFMCEGESVQTAEKTEKQLMLDLQPDFNLDLMCEGGSAQITEKTPVIDFQPEVNVHLKCGGEHVQIAEEAKKLLKRDLKPEVNLDLMVEGQSAQIAEKNKTQPQLDLQPEVNRFMCEGESVQTTEKTEKQPPLVLQPVKLSLLDLLPGVKVHLMCEGEFVQTDEKTEKQPQLDTQPKLDLICEGQSKKTELKPLIRDLQPDLNLDLTHEFVQIPEKMDKLSIPDLQLEINHILICTSSLKSLELNGCKSQSATGVKSVGCSAVQDKAAVTPRKPEQTAVTNLQNLLANLDLESKHPPNLKSPEHVNEIKICDVEVSQTGLKENPEEISARENHLKLHEDFETVELLILEDSDLQEIEGTEKNRLRKTKTALRTEAKLHKTKPSGLKMVNVRKPTENKFELYSKHWKQTCHMTAPVKRKEEMERVSAIQVKKNLPEAKPKLDCQVRKQPHQTSNRIPTATEASRETSELHITKPHSMNRSQRHQAPKAETHQHGKPHGQSKSCIIASPCPEKLSTGEMTTHQIQQRQPSTVHSSIGSTSSPKQPHVQPNRPKTTQSDQHVSRKHSAPTVSPSGTTFPRQIKNLKQTSGSKKKKE